jgi:hypothetical protein
MPCVSLFDQKITIIFGGDAGDKGDLGDTGDILV